MEVFNPALLLELELRKPNPDQETIALLESIIHGEIDPSFGMVEVALSLGGLEVAESDG